MITEFLWPQLDGMDTEGMCFQQDGASCHTLGETMELLGEKFPGRVISRNSDRNSQPRSCDLSLCDFFLWGFVKSRVYANKPQTIPELKAEIGRVIGETELQLCENVENFVKRARVCQQSWGTFVGYCFPQLIAVCVLYIEIKISTLFELLMYFIRKLYLVLIGTPCTLFGSCIIQILNTGCANFKKKKLRRQRVNRIVL
jgi:hypothetical protein